MLTKIKICKNDNLAKANITLVRKRIYKQQLSFLAILAVLYNCLYYTKLVLFIEKVK